MRVLIAEDEPAIRSMIAKYLRDEGFDVIAEVGSGVEAVEESTRLSPDLVVSDLDMPEMTGLEALPLILRACPAARVIICSAGVEHEVTALELGAVGFIAKPFNPRFFAERVKELAGG